MFILLFMWIYYNFKMRGASIIAFNHKSVNVVNYGDGITQEDVDYLSLVTMGKATLSQVPGN